MSEPKTGTCRFCSHNVYDHDLQAEYLRMPTDPIPCPHCPNGWCVPSDAKRPGGPVTTDHYAEALQALSRADVDSPEMTLRAALVAAAQVHATLALADAVRALKAGATVTTTHVEVERCPSCGLLGPHGFPCQAKFGPRAEEAPRG